MVKSILLGHSIAAPRVPFFGQLQHTPLPPSCLVRFRFSIPRFGEDAIWGMNGPYHIAKNIAAKFRGHMRTIMLGSFAVDVSATRDQGMPPSAFNGFDAQSDMQAAVFYNPFYLVDELEKPRVPWALKGTLLLNVLEALLLSSILHKRLSVQQRCENAMTAHTLLDIFKMLSLEHEDTYGFARGSCFIPAMTMKNMMELAGFIVIQCMSVPEGYAFRPWASTELPIEQFFGLVRGQFSSAQVSVRDFLYSSTIVARQYQSHLQKATEADVIRPDPGQKAVTDVEFRQLAEQSLKAAVKLVHHCSGRSEDHLRRMYLACGDSVTLYADDAARLCDLCYGCDDMCFHCWGVFGFCSGTTCQRFQKTNHRDNIKNAIN